MPDWTMKHNLLPYSKVWKQRMRQMQGVSQDVLNTIGKYMMVETKKRFDNQVSPDGEPWKPLNELTKRRRKKGGGRVGSGHKALLDTGAGKMSITYQLVGEETVRIGPGNLTNVFYLVYHQSGFQSTITEKQAWWMVFNLYGFDPRRPRKFIDTEERDKDKADFLGWLAARGLAKALKGSTLTVPQRAFAGVNEENIKEMRKITIMRIRRAWGMRQVS